jgi:hypothetical protein
MTWCSRVNTCSISAKYGARAARWLAERHGLAPSFETARMPRKYRCPHRNRAPEPPLQCIFGITGFELGSPPRK